MICRLVPEPGERPSRANCAFLLGRQPRSAILVDDQPVLGQLDVSGLFKSGDDRVEVPVEQRQQARCW